MLKLFYVNPLTGSINKGCIVFKDNYFVKFKELPDAYLGMNFVSTIKESLFELSNKIKRINDEYKRNLH